MITIIRTGTALGERSPGRALLRLDGGKLGPALLRGTKTLYFFRASR
jgi:hypothetical protein